MIAIDQHLDLTKHLLSNTGGGGASLSKALRDGECRLVGQELWGGGQLLLAWREHHQRSSSSSSAATRVALYSLAHRRITTNIYQHDSPIDIVSASINESCDLLAFTVRHSGGNDGGTPPRYETWLVEVNEHERRVFALGPATTQQQRVQFVSGSGHDDSIIEGSGVRKDFLLFILDGESIQLYSLTMQQQQQLPPRRTLTTSSAPAPPRQWVIREQPRKENTIAKRHLWWQYDQHTQTLFFLVVRASAATTAPAASTPAIGVSTSGTAAATSNHSLRSVQLGHMAKPTNATSEASSYFYHGGSDSMSKFVGLWSDLEFTIPREFPCATTSSRRSVVTRLTDGTIDTIALSTFEDLSTSLHACIRVHTVFWNYQNADEVYGMSRAGFGVPTLASSAGHGYMCFDVPQRDANDAATILKSLCVLTTNNLLIFTVPGGRYLRVVNVCRGRASTCFMREQSDSPVIHIAKQFFPLANEPGAMSFGPCLLSKDLKIYRYRLVAIDSAQALLVHLKQSSTNGGGECVRAFLGMAILHLGISDSVFKELLRSILQDKLFRPFAVDIMSEAITVLTYRAICAKTPSVVVRLIPATTAPNEATFFSGEVHLRRTDPKLSKTSYSEYLFAGVDAQTSAPFNFDAQIRVSAQIPSAAMLSAAVMGSGRAGAVANEATWSKLLSEYWVREAQQIEADKYANKAAGIPAKKAWDGLLSRLFSSEQSSATTSMSASSSSLLPTDSAGDQSSSAARSSPPDDVSIIRRAFVDSLNNYVSTRASSLLIRQNMHQLPSASSPLGVSYSSSPGMSRSLRTSFTLSSSSTTLHERIAQSKLAPGNMAKEYAQQQLVQAAYIWNVLSDVYRFPKSSHFDECRCGNCYRRTRRRSQPSSNQLYRPSSLPLMMTSTSMARKNNAKIRNRFITNVMRAAGNNRGDAANDSDADLVDGEGDADASGESHPSSSTIRVEDEMMLMFDVLEDFYLVMGELCVPIPVGFHSKFVLIGFHTLPRDVFLQYLNRGMFQVTDDFLKHCYGVLRAHTGRQTASEEDMNFLFQVLGACASESKLVRVLSQMQDFQSFVVDESIQKFYYDEPSLWDADEWRGGEQSPPADELLETAIHTDPKAALPSSRGPRQISFSQDGDALSEPDLSLDGATPRSFPHRALWGQQRNRRGGGGSPGSPPMTAPGQHPHSPLSKSFRDSKTFAEAFRSMSMNISSEDEEDARDDDKQATTVPEVGNVFLPYAVLLEYLTSKGFPEQEIDAFKRAYAPLFTKQ